MDRVGWLETFPETFAGVVVANELLDAMPVQLFEWQANAEAELQEMGVTNVVQNHIHPSKVIGSSIKLLLRSKSVV